MNIYLLQSSWLIFGIRFLDMEATSTCKRKVSKAVGQEKEVPSFFGEQTGLLC